MSIYFSRDKQNGQPHLEPFQLQYQAIPDTPKSSKTSVPGTPTTPITSPSSVISPASSSSLTSGMQSMNIGRGRGRPQKQLIEPSMEGFPEHGTGDEHRWLKMKVTELWQYNMLTSDQSAELRKKENAHVCEYYCKKKVAEAAAASGQPPPRPPTPSADYDTPDSQDKAREKSRLRYVK